MADVPVIISKSIRLREGAAPSNPVNIGTPQEPLNPDGGGGVVPHNELAGLQGGTATERYHIDEDQYDAVNGANTPSSTNVFATIADLEGIERENNTVLFDKDYVIGNAGARTGNILFDFTGARLKANSIMLHNDIVEPTFPANAKIIFGEYKINQDNYIYFEIINKGLSSEIVLVHIYQQDIFSFIATFNTANTSSGSSNSDQIKLPLISSGTYDFVVDWGDNTSDVITAWNQLELTHTYLTSGIYVVKIKGLCRGWEFQNTGDRLKITDISQWGDIRFTTQTNINLGAFRGCANLNISATDIPVFDIQGLAGFFRQCTNLTGNTSFNNWNMSSVNNFTSMFRDAVNFNQNIGSWNVSSGIDFSNMFRRATSFNQNIGSWDVSSATNFTSMFETATSFNQNIGSWDVSSATNFGFMFYQSTSFNQNIGSWDVSSGTNFTSMFDEATLFNQNIGSWDVSNGTIFINMFRRASAFNQDIGSWNVSSGINFEAMFRDATAFNQDIGSWNVSNGTNFANFMQGKTDANYSAENLDSIYNGWSALTLVSGRTITFNTIKYTASGQAGRDILTGAPNNWTITDGGT
jgi:hypothetical protein